MLTHDNDNFPSDVYTIMEAVGATVTIGNYTDYNDLLIVDLHKMISISYREWFRGISIVGLPSQRYD